MQYHLTIKRNEDTCYNMYEPPKHYAKWKKSDTQKQYCIVPKVSRKGISTEVESTAVVA